jgi:magnesium chelatase subunit D
MPGARVPEPRLPAARAPQQPQDADAAAESLRAQDAWRAAACLAVDPVGLGGAVLRTDLGEATDAWLASLAAALPAGECVRRLPPHIDDERLLGGTDLAATLRAGRPVHARGLLEECARGILVLPMAERAEAQLAARLGAALDQRVVHVARDGQQREFTTRFALVALDGGRASDEQCVARLRERLALHVDLAGLRADPPPALAPAELEAARALLPRIAVGDEALQALCATALACGIATLRAPLLALRAARAHAAVEGRDGLDEQDLAFAARLVLAPRATVDPAAQAAEPEPPQEPPPPPPDSPGDQPPEPQAQSEVDKLEDSIQSAAQAAIPKDLLERLAAAELARARSGTAGRSGANVLAKRRGRPAGVRAGRPGADTRLNLLATLRSAAPWQRLRGREPGVQAGSHAGRVRVLPDDFRVTWYRQRKQTVTIFAIDASGSSALHRLAEAKGAVELLLAGCYVRRDEVAVIAFRGRQAELVLPPTRSLVRVKRSLAGLPGGGGTPMASALDLAARLVLQVAKRGQTPTLVLLTDGHANVARDGTGGRARAEADALASAKQLRPLCARMLLVDTAPRPQAQSQLLADTLAARYLALPHADARRVAEAVRLAG